MRVTTFMSIAFALLGTACASVWGFDDLRSGQSLDAGSTNVGGPKDDGGSSGDASPASRAQTDGAGVPVDGPSFPPDANVACRGNALVCIAFSDSAQCGAQIGCTWSAPACTGAATGCATTDPNVCYIRQPACGWDFNQSQCLPASDWCSVSDPSTCTQRSGCSWSGGCGGTQAACDTLALAQCGGQRGCSVVAQ
jgi:hypothetical protein